MLFCVTTRGRERIFSNPRDSAMVRIKSTRMLLLALTNEKPLVGPVAGKFENSGICPAAPADWMYNGCNPFSVIGEDPTDPAPPAAVGPLPQPKPNCVPMSRAKLRVAATTR